MIPWFVKTEMTYIKHNSCRFCKNYLSTLNGLKDVTCRRTCRVYVGASWMQQFLLTLGLLFVLIVSCQGWKTVSKKPVPISELACFISSLVNLLADLTCLQNGIYAVMDTQSVTVVVIPSKTGGKQYMTLYIKHEVNWFRIWK